MLPLIRSSATGMHKQKVWTAAAGAMILLLLLFLSTTDARQQPATTTTTAAGNGENHTGAGLSRDLMNNRFSALYSGNMTVPITLLTNRTTVGSSKVWVGANSSTDAATVQVASELLQKLVQLQPVLSMLRQPGAKPNSKQQQQQHQPAAQVVQQTEQELPTTVAGSNKTRSLLAYSTAAAAGTSATSTSAMTTTAGTASPAGGSTSSTSNWLNNAKLITSFVNLLQSDAWQAIYNGFCIASASVHLLQVVLLSSVTGHVTVDSQLVLDLADLAADFGAQVSWLVSSITQLVSDAEQPLGLSG